MAINTLDGAMSAGKGEVCQVVVKQSWLPGDIIMANHTILREIALDVIGGGGSVKIDLVAAEAISWQAAEPVIGMAVTANQVSMGTM